MIVSLEAKEADDDFRLVESNAAFVEMLLEQLIMPEEISADAIRCYCVSEFAFQIDNGGFLQYVFNSELDPLAVTSLTEGLKCIGATRTLQALLVCLKQWENLETEQQDAFVNSSFFENKALFAQFEQVNRDLTDARDEEDIIDLAACWLKSLSRIRYVHEDDFETEVEKRSALIPNLSERRRERSNTTPWRKD